MERVSNVLKVFVKVCLLLIFLVLCSNCSKEMDSLYIDSPKTDEGICIYPLKSMQVIYPDSASFSTIEQLGDQPYISYSDIVYYDTVFHIIQLKYTSTRLEQKLDKNYLRFAVTLNGKILYRGNFVYKPGISSSSEPVIILNSENDTLGPNKIRIYQQFPIYNTNNYSDLRYQPELNKLMKADKKACGSLFDSAKPAVDQGSGIEFYFIDGISGIEDSSDFSKVTFVDKNINLENLKLAPNPFITDSQIAFYDTSQNIFYLREPVSFSEFTNEQIINKFFAITVNKTPVVVGGFYLSAISTASCPYIHIFLDEPYQNPINKYLLRLYPGSYTSNPVYFKINSSSMLQRLSRGGKLKNNFVI